jgi:Tfp pilus assembly protein PilE
MNLRIFPPKTNPAVPRRTAERGFSFVEVCIAVAVSVIFGGAAFATNQQLLMKLRTQKETTAATLMLQERLENFRGRAWSDIANTDYVQGNIVSIATTSEAVLGSSFTETTTVSGYVTIGGILAANPPTDANSWVRDAGHPSGYNVQSCAKLAVDYNLLKVDIVVTWNGVNGRSRTREMTQIFGKGNIGE